MFILQTKETLMAPRHFSYEGWVNHQKRKTAEEILEVINGSEVYLDRAECGELRVYDTERRRHLNVVIYDDEEDEGDKSAEG